MEPIVEVKQEDIDTLEKSIKKYPDFPISGVLFYDIFSILSCPKLSKIMYDNSVAVIKNYFDSKQVHFNCIAGLESRGFLIGAILAEKFGVGFIPIRKKNKKNTKLPGEILSITYKTEYSEDAFDVQKLSFDENSRVLLVDDLLATGGSLQATETLILSTGAQVIATFCVFEVAFLKGKNKLKDPSSCLSLISVS